MRHSIVLSIPNRCAIAVNSVELHDESKRLSAKFLFLTYSNLEKQYHDNSCDTCYKLPASERHLVRDACAYFGHGPDSVIQDGKRVCAACYELWNMDVMTNHLDPNVHTFLHRPMPPIQSKKAMAEFLEEQFVADVMICEEKHKDGHRHWHVLMHREDKFRNSLKNLRKAATWEGIAPNVQVVVNYGAVVNYISKEDKEPYGPLWMVSGLAAPKIKDESKQASEFIGMLFIECHSLVRELVTSEYCNMSGNIYHPLDYVAKRRLGLFIAEWKSPYICDLCHVCPIVGCCLVDVFEPQWLWPAIRKRSLNWMCRNEHVYHCFDKKHHSSDDDCDCRFIM